MRRFDRPAIVLFAALVGLTAACATPGSAASRADAQSPAQRAHDDHAARMAAEEAGESKRKSATRGDQAYDRHTRQRVVDQPVRP